MKTLCIAIVQHRPSHLDLVGSTRKALSLINEAAANGARLIVFGESWLSGYPAWIDHCPEISLWNNHTMKEIFYQLHINSPAINGKEIRLLCVAAKQAGVIVCIGLNEKITSSPGSGTIFNSFIIINQMGEIVNHHRKLVPTFNEKLLYGQGDALGLKTVETPWGKLGGLICWEHWMPLGRQELHNENELIHIAFWPAVHENHQLASRHYALEGRCFVIAAGQLMQVKDIPAALTIPEHLKNTPEKYILNGGSCVIAPDGTYLAAPLFDKEDILYCTINDFGTAVREKLTLDTTGHYSRWDIFDFSVSRERKIFPAN